MPTAATSTPPRVTWISDCRARIDTGQAEQAAQAAGFETGHGQLALSGLCPDCR